MVKLNGYMLLILYMHCFEILTVVAWPEDLRIASSGRALYILLQCCSIVIVQFEKL